ncbi:tRNA lysidine(34) synthetase TilS [Xanthobacter dioxanivorans]|uniref:tRNA lysidine(34) synthetase TilS n=1 Tax=Xanthobacter dioxanivorans TaxID=2528964 RepID=UPI001E4C6C18|nr:tRNA lysidine(34) synthetase TilS [Xanthobacter dioxanivorans]
MSDADERRPIADDELSGLFAGFDRYSSILIAVSGGPDSTALLHLAARWRAGAGAGPTLVAATIDHGFRPASADEATMVAQQAQALGVPHRTLAWTGTKPARGIQAAARAARYALLTAAARQAGAQAIAVAHTLDDQAETVLFRLARGSGLAGLAGMQAVSTRDGLDLLRPFLGVPKARLVATLEAAGIAFAEDPSNLDGRFTRARLRVLMPALAAEELSARRFATFSRRAARADAALEATTDDAVQRLSPVPWRHGGPARLDRAGFADLPEEIALRLIGRALAHAGTEGPVELAKLEVLTQALRVAAENGPAPFRRTLAGALVAIRGGEVTVTSAPPRGKSAFRRRIQGRLRPASLARAGVAPRLSSGWCGRFHRRRAGEEGFPSLW